MANRIKLAGTTSNDFEVGLTGTGNTTTGNITVATSTQTGNIQVIQNSNTVGTSAIRIAGNYTTGGGAGQIQTLNFAGTPSSPTPLADNDYTFQIQNLAYTGPTGGYEPVANYGFVGDFAFHKNDEIPTPTGFNYVGGFFQITQFGNDGTNDNLYDYNLHNGVLNIGGFSPTGGFGPANTNFTVTVQDSTGATNSFSFLNNGNFSGSNNVTANYFYGDGSHLSNLQVANVSGLGNIASINLDGSSSNVLYGNGSWAPAGGSYGNSNVAGFLANFGSNIINTTGVISANGSGLSSLNGSNVTGQVPYAAVANSVAVANVGGIGNIATINLTGSSSNVLYGNGAFAPISVTSVANANYANFANLASFVSIVNDAANVTNQQVLYCNSGGGNSQLKYDSSFTYNPDSNNLSVGNTITSQRYVSNISTGTAPFVVTSTTQVANLNVATAGSATTAGTVTTAAQPNITSVGTLTSLAVTGNITSGNANVTGQFISTVATGTAPFVVTSTTQVANLSVATAGSATTAGTVTTAAQPNITSVGTLSSVSVSGTATIGNLAMTKFNETVVASANTSTSISPDLASGSIFAYTANNNFTFNGFTNAVAGSSGVVKITQDGTGNRLLTSTMKFAGGSKTLSTAANSIDIISVYYDGSTYYATLSKGYA